jgi:prevent-host-death family protein
MRVGVRDFRNRATEILRDVRTNRAEYVLTYYGQPVAVLLPVDEGGLAEKLGRTAEATVTGDDVWAELEAIRKEIGETCESDKTAVELVSEQRRDPEPWQRLFESLDQFSADYMEDREQPAQQDRRHPFQ